jgi:hypothetical protein
VALLQADRVARGMPPLSPLDALLRLHDTADDIAASNPGMTGYGGGRLNLLRALTAPPTSRAMPLAISGDASTVGPPVVFWVSGEWRIAWATGAWCWPTSPGAWCGR